MVTMYVIQGVTEQEAKPGRDWWNKTLSQVNILGDLMIVDDDCFDYLNARWWSSTKRLTSITPFYTIKHDRGSCKVKWTVAAACSLDLQQHQHQQLHQHEPRLRSGSIKVGMQGLWWWRTVCIAINIVNLATYSSSALYWWSINIIIQISLMVPFQDTFDDLSQALREEENFNPLKFTEKIKDVRNTKRADMTGKKMIMMTSEHIDVGPLQHIGCFTLSFVSCLIWPVLHNSCWVTWVDWYYSGHSDCQWLLWHCGVVLSEKGKKWLGRPQCNVKNSDMSE